MEDFFLKDFLKEDLQLIDENSPYNLVDALVFSTLTYIPFGKIDTTFYDGYYYEYKIKGLPLNTILEELLTKEELLKAKFLVKKNKLLCEYTNFCDIFTELKDNNRYRDIKIIDYKAILDVHNSEKKMPCQFACFLYEIEEGKEYVVAYRGTDSNFEGWIEDMLMIFDDVKAQQESLKFLEDVIEKYKDAKIHITGHSKGGNCAYYSLIKANEKDRLDGIFFEAPLFNEAFVTENKEVMCSLREEKKSYFVNVEHSVVSNIYFGHEYAKSIDNTIFIKSKNKSLIKEHNVYSYLFENGCLCETIESNISKSFNKAFNEVQNLSMETLETALTCIVSLLGRTSKTSVFSKELTFVQAFELYVDNFINMDSCELFELSKFYRKYYETIQDFKNENEIEEELLKYYKIFDFINIFALADTLEDVDKFKIKLDKFRKSKIFLSLK